MKDFIYYAPTQVVFGALSEDKTGKLVKQYSGTKVLVHYGGQSAERSGLLDKICRALEAEGIAYVNRWLFKRLVFRRRSAKEDTRF